MKRQFGKEWFQPKGLVILPSFVVEQYTTLQTIEKTLEVELKQEFLKNIKEIMNNPNQSTTFDGYLLLDFDLEGLDVRDNMPVHAALVSTAVIKIVELVYEERCIEDAEEKLENRISAINNHINDGISVKGVIVFPHKSRPTRSIMHSDDEPVVILYKEQLSKLFSIPKSSPTSSQVPLDTKVAMAEMLYFGYFKPKRPETEEEAIWQAAQRFFCQRHSSKIEACTQITFNSIELTELQKVIMNDLLKGNTLLRGGYGIGKTVTIVAAIKESVKRYKTLLRQREHQQINFKILYVSAQSQLAGIDLEISPFLMMIETWIKEVCRDLRCFNDLQVLDYTYFLSQSIDSVMQTLPSTKKQIIFYSYLLQGTDLQILDEALTHCGNFDITVFEETHALSHSVMERLPKYFKREETNERKSKVWVTSNAEALSSSLLERFNVSPKLEQYIKSKNMRNTPTVANLAEAVNTDLMIERYPSMPMPISSVICNIHATYEYEFDDRERLLKIVELAKSWNNLFIKFNNVTKSGKFSMSSVLFIDCEESSLFEELCREGIPVNLNDGRYEADRALLLKHSDPIEAIVAGAEWHILIIHIKEKTMNSSKVNKVFNKRIISRATTKVVIYSDIEKKINVNHRNNASGSMDETSSKGQPGNELNTSDEAGKEGKYLYYAESIKYYLRVISPVNYLRFTERALVPELKVGSMSRQPLWFELMVFQK